eukprot:7507037-Karenia_brevis.AAC.1
MSDLLKMMPKEFKAIKRECMDADAFVDVHSRLHECHPYELVIVFEALGRAVCLPTTMLLDSFKAILSWVLDKEMDVQWDSYTLIQRFWVAITTDPGSAKSPALKTCLRLLEEVFKDVKLQGCFRGHAKHGFHIIHDSTHAAFNARLNQADGYGLPLSAEGGNLLCEQYRDKGKFGKESINMLKCLEAGNGGAYHWDIQETVNTRRRKQQDERGAAHEEGTHHDTTNITFLLFQQKS